VTQHQDGELVHTLTLLTAYMTPLIFFYANIVVWLVVRFFVQSLSFIVVLDLDLVLVPSYRIHVCRDPYM